MARTLARRDHVGMTTISDPTTDELAERIFGALLGTVDILSVFLGDRLGWYRSLASDGPATPTQLADRTATHPRYAREWLEQQAVTGFLALDHPDDDPDARVYSIPAATAEVMTDQSSLSYLAPFARMFAAVGPQLPELLEAYRTGGGVSWEQLGELARESQADVNRPWLDRLPTELAKLPGLQDLLSRPGARLADVGTGAGWSALALAAAYPQLDIIGVDTDRPSVEMARENAMAAGLESRVRFIHDDAGNLATYGTFDVILALECLHDMPYPVAVLTAMRTAVRPDGSVLILDEAVNDRLTPSADSLEKLMYGYSLFVCLPDGMSHPGSAGTGTVMRPSVLTDYARQAGFSSVDVVLDEFGFWRLYSLR